MFRRFFTRLQHRALLRPKTGESVILRDLLARSPLFQRKPPSYVDYAVPLVILTIMTT